MASSTLALTEEKYYKENNFITQQIGCIKHPLIFEYLSHDDFNNTDNVKTAQN